MSETAVLESSAPERTVGFLSVRIGWRNLWRNHRRTWLTAGGIAFSILLVMSFMALQYGQYDVMIDSGTSLLPGHLQITPEAYLDDNRFEDTLSDVEALITQVSAVPGVLSISPRVEAFALVSADQRSFGAQILGVDPQLESQTVRYLKMLAAGSQPVGPEDAVLGSILARNLGIGVGDELVVLGSGKEGGVAALVLTVSGILETGTVDLDRSLLVAPIATVRDGFYLGDEAHTLALRLRDPADAREMATRLASQLPAALAVRPWQEVMPELKQAIDVDKIGGQLMYGIIMLLVMFSVVNSFIMTIFERTRELGMLLAIGMKPRSIIAMLQWEALFLWVLGTALGGGLAVLLIAWLQDVGIYLGEDMEAYARQFYMPARLFPGFSAEVLLVSPLVMLIGTQLAALIPALRIHHIRPVTALRAT